MNRYQVAYTRNILNGIGVEEIHREIYARTYKDMVRAVQGLPRFSQFLAGYKVAPESPAEVAARRFREDAGEVPHGC